MYQKCAISVLLLYLCSAIIGAAFCIQGIDMNLFLSQVLQEKEEATGAVTKEALAVDEVQLVEKVCFEGQAIPITEKNIEIPYQVIEKNYCIRLSQTDYQVLLQIVEAEAGGEDYTGKLLVADVIINRVRSEKFPNTIKDVVYQQEGNVSQFTPVYDGRINTVDVSQETREAVEAALLGQDDSQGALYFVNRQYADPVRMQWFDNHLTRLFDYGGHEFFL